MFGSLDHGGWEGNLFEHNGEIEAGERQALKAGKSPVLLVIRLNKRQP